MAAGVLQEQAMLELGAVDTNELLQLLECPVCLDHITPPVKQCIKGHLVCTDCFPRLPHCPTCRSTMSTERNLAMEQVSRLLQFPCRYHPMGCKISAPLSLKAEHERNCDYLQLKCPFHGQCSFSGSLNMVTPHLKSEHAVTPVPVQPNGTLFYRAKQFAKRNLWAFIYQWDKNMFRFLVKHIHASSVGRTDNCNLVVAHVQYIGPDSMAAQYAYQISLFDAERRTNGPKFEGIVSSTMKPLESQVSKDEVFVATTYTAREYTDQFGQLNFIITMRSLKEKEHKKRDSSSSRPRHRPNTSRPPPTNITPVPAAGANPAQAGPSNAAPAVSGGAAIPVVAAGSSSAPGVRAAAVASSSSEPVAGPSGVQSSAAITANSSSSSNNIPVNLSTSAAREAASSSPSTSSSSNSSESVPTSSSSSSSQSVTPATSTGETQSTVTTTNTSTNMDTSEDNVVVSTNPQL